LPYTEGKLVQPLPPMPAGGLPNHTPPPPQLQQPQQQPQPPQPQQSYPPQQPYQPQPNYGQPANGAQPPAYAQQWAQPQPPTYQPAYQPAYQPPVDPAVALLANQVGQLTNLVSGLARQMQPVPPVAQPQQQPAGPQSRLRTMPEGGGELPPVPPIAHNPRPIPQYDEEYAPRQTIKDMEHREQSERVREGVVTGFETLNMKFINGPLAQKPKQEVVFQIPGVGTTSCRFHAVVEGGGCVALIYDTRFEDGVQFLPPDMGEAQIRVSLPRHEKSWTCSSLGIQFSVGVLDIVVLVQQTDSAVNPQDDDDEDY
jgi:hypothetical protein